MKTKKELQQLSLAIRAAEKAYSNAIIENLTEGGEKKVVDYDEGLRLSIIGDDAVEEEVIDKIRFNEERNKVEIHICERVFGNVSECDEWEDICDLTSSDIKIVYANIVWED